MNNISRYVPWVVVGACALYVFVAMSPPREPADKMQLSEFGKLPVLERGRVKPFDSLARNNLLIISKRQHYTDENKKNQPAIRWLLDVMVSGVLRGDDALKHKVFRIEHDQVLSLLELKARPQFFRYSIEEIRPRWEQLLAEAQRADRRRKEGKPLDLYDQKIEALAGHLELYINLASLDDPVRAVPRAKVEDWKPFRRAFADAVQNGEDDPAARSLATLLVAYKESDAKKFNSELTTYRQRLDEQYPDVMRKTDFEVFFNHFAPFYQCTLLYVVVFILACLSWVGFTETLNRTAFWLTVLTLIVHTWALCARMYILERPPIINLYSTAIFIGWGCVLLGVILERLYWNGTGNVLAAITGSLTLIIAHHLAERSGETMEMLQAVLDTNFWLATHVTIINSGYAATFVAGWLGVLFILRGMLTRSLDRTNVQALGRMIYGILCFGTLLSFTGTVLGGIWGDQSWGRFWGWDPKENGALLIVIWNALILHARWGGMVKQRGMAVLAVLGNIITTWSWFGVNELGVGLHAYGFTEGTIFWLIVFDLSQLAIVAVGSLPLKYWRSFATPQPALRARPGAQPA